MFAKGPGEGYMAAKDEALALDSTLKCVRYPGLGYRIERGGVPLPYPDGDTGRERWGWGRSARDAWGSALDYLRNHHDQ